MKKSKLSSTRSRKRSTANSKAKTNHRKKLNVRVNSKKSVSVRRKLFMIRFLKWSAVAAILCVIAIGVYRGVDRFLFESPKFSLTKIIIRLTEHCRRRGFLETLALNLEIMY